MKKNLILVGIVLVIGLLVWILFFDRKSEQNTPSTPVTKSDTETIPKKEFPCNSDAKQCPDGSYVGRTGPDCQFADCPPLNASFARIETYLGGRNGGLFLTLHPIEVISDTRCPPGVRCEKKGTVEVRVGIATQVGHGELNFKLGETQTIRDLQETLTVTLVEVRPSTKAEAKNPENGYWFVFEVRK